MSISIKQELRLLIENLPDDVSWDVVWEQLRFQQAAVEGRGAADRGEFASDEDVRRVFARYGVTP